VGGATTVIFAWSPPTATGGGAILGYEVVVLTFRNGRQVASKAYAVAASRRSFEVQLPKKAGITYAAIVRVRNGVGWSSFSTRSNAVAPR
jgi:hypothetical protein